MCTSMEMFKKNILEKREDDVDSKEEKVLIVNMHNNGIFINGITRCTDLEQEEVYYYLDLNSKKYIN